MKKRVSTAKIRHDSREKLAREYVARLERLRGVDMGLMHYQADLIIVEYLKYIGRKDIAEAWENLGLKGYE